MFPCGIDVFWGPLAAARTHGLRGLAEGLVVAMASLMLNPASSVMESAALIARGWEQELSRSPSSQQPYRISNEQCFLEYLMQQIRSDEFAGVSPRTCFELSALNPTVSAAAGAATMLTLTSQISRVTLPRLLCGPWHVLRGKDPEDSLVQLVLMRLGEFHRLPYSAHLVDQNPLPAAADLAAVLANGTRRGSYDEGGDQAVCLNPLCSVGIVILLLLGFKCVLLVGWPLGPVLVFDSSLIGSVHITEDTVPGRPTCCAVLVCIELTKAVQRQVHLRSSAAAAASVQRDGTPSDSHQGWGRSLQLLINFSFQGRHDGVELNFAEDELGMRTHNFFKIADLSPEDSTVMGSAGPASAVDPPTALLNCVEPDPSYLTPESSIISSDDDSSNYAEELWQGLKQRAPKWLLLQVMALT